MPPRTGPAPESRPSDGLLLVVLLMTLVFGLAFALSVAGIAPGPVSGPTLAPGQIHSAALGSCAR